ncbi:hypothetical protein RCO28_34225 [Streptomyces sp. LHD-70]|uniref:hypothetical protein n=1 Tax=Streptomyces sp. LHD-70 TaxID=3072140 RepID=UPI0028101C22|nr:hypothetical protein [Streptomyces sp. LHD-70]MDQ8707490.1 hypothetical protein [Streptomyces sp. LHD-70]
MNELLVMAGTIDDATQITKDLNALMVHGVMGLLVTAATITTRWQTKSWVAAATAFVAGVACWYGVANATVFRDKVGEDLAPKAARPAHGQVLVLDQVPGPASGDESEVRR